MSMVSGAMCTSSDVSFNVKDIHRSFISLLYLECLSFCTCTVFEVICTVVQFVFYFTFLFLFFILCIGNHFYI